MKLRPADVALFSPGKGPFLWGVLLAAVALGCQCGEVRPLGAAQQTRAEPRRGGAGNAALVADPDVVQGVLANGVRYLVRPAPGAEEEAYVGVVVRVGALMEEESERGVAHLVEHLVFDPAVTGDTAKAFPRATATAIGEGAEAATHYGHTTYRFAVPPSRLEDALGWLSARMSLRGWSRGAVEAEKNVVVREVRERAQDLGFDARRLLTAGTALGRVPPVGTEASVRALSVDQVLAFHRRSYRPANLVVVASGTFAAERAVALVDRHFGSLPREPEDRESTAVLRKSVPRAKEWVVGGRQSQRHLQNATVRYHLAPGAAPSNEPDEVDRLLDRALCTLLRTRLEDPGFGCGVQDQGAQLQMLSIVYRGPGGSLKSTVEKLEGQLVLALEQGFSAPERKAALDRVLLELQRAARVPESPAVVWDRLEVSAANGQVPRSPAQQLELATRWRPRLTAGDWRRRARRWFERSRQVVLAIGQPGDASVPDAAALRKIAEEAAPAAVEVPVEPFEYAPEPGEILAEEALPELDATRWQLANGARVFYKLVPPALGRNARLRVIEPRAAMTEQMAFTQARGVIDWLGSEHRSASELARQRAARRIRLSFVPEVNASMPSGDIDVALAHVHGQLTAPSWMTEAPPAAGAPGSGHAAELLERYRAHYADVAGLSFLIVASAPRRQVRGWVAQYVASLPGSGPPARSSDGYATADRAARVGPRGATPGVEREQLDRSDGNVDARLELEFTGSASPQQGRLELELLRRYVYARLMSELRTRRKVIWSAGAWLSWSGDDYRLRFAFDCAPEQLDELRRSALEVLASAVETEATEGELLDLRAVFQRDMKRRFRQASFWMEELARAEREGADPRRIVEMADVARGLDASRLQGFARRWLTLDRYLERVYLPPPPKNEADRKH